MAISAYNFDDMFFSECCVTLIEARSQARQNLEIKPIKYFFSIWLSKTAVEVNLVYQEIFIAINDVKWVALL